MNESLSLEFKREYGDDIKYAVVAMANSEGGEILIGVDDDGNALGIADVDDVMLRACSMIRNVIYPDVSIFTKISVKSFQGKQVVSIVVQRGTARPYYLRVKGVCPEGVYVRQGAASVPASPTFILKLIKETAGDNFEEARALNQNLTFESAGTVFNLQNLNFEDAQKRTLKLISDDGTFTNLAMLLSDQCVQGIKMAVFEGTQKRVFHDRTELNGSVFKQMEDGFAFLQKYNRTRSEFPELRRVDTKDYPPEALREALLNTIIHRDYEFGDSAFISIFDDRIEFVSIGGLVAGIQFEDLSMGVSKLRNKNLANVFYRLELVEAYGTGLAKIRECYLSCVAQPKIEVSPNAFKLTLPNMNFLREKESRAVNENLLAYGVSPASKLVANVPAIKKIAKLREEQVLAMFLKEETISRERVESVLKISRSSAGDLLRKMVLEKKIQKIGTTKSATYKKY